MPRAARAGEAAVKALGFVLVLVAAAVVLGIAIVDTIDWHRAGRPVDPQAGVE